MTSRPSKSASKKTRSGSKTKASAAKGKRGKTPRGKSKSAQHPWRRRLWSLGWKLGLVLLVAIGAWGIYLDSHIQQRFAQGRWDLPAQVFARPLALTGNLAYQEVLEELDLLGYQRVTEPTAAGEYAVSATRVEVYRRQVITPWGDQPPERLMLSFNNGRLASVKSSRGSDSSTRQMLDPVELGRLTEAGDEDRVFVPLERIPPLLIDTLLLVEDKDFHDHHGVDPVAILRALWVNLREGRTVQGGSTITQQLAKNFFLSNERRLVRKLNEAYMAVLLELRYSKAEILESYINEVALGQHGARSIHGFPLASRHYFGRPLSELDPEQMALLVAMVKGPSWYDPRRNAERALERRDLVLRLMLNQQLLTDSGYQRAVSRDMGLSDRPLPSRPYPAYLDHVRRELRQDFAQLPRGEGVRIFTAFDPLAQRAAEHAMKHQLGQVEKASGKRSLQGAIAVVDRSTGGIRALVGDRKVNYPGFNRALDARRPIGSLIKPVVFLTALSDPAHYHLATPLKDQPIVLESNSGKRWQPRNYDRQYLGQVSLIDALADSRNVPTVNLGMTVGLDKVIANLRALNVEAEVEAYPSMLLGSVALSPLEVAELYQGLANGGRPLPAHTVIAVLDGDGQLLRGRQLKSRQAVDADAAYLTDFALQAVTRQGTARRLSREFTQATLAGKTGTSNELRDSWFAGYDQRDVVAIWVGRDDNQPAGLTGSSGALPLFIDYFHQRPPQSLQRSRPAGVEMAHFSHNSGQPVSSRCTDSRPLPAVASALPPTQRCGRPATAPSTAGDPAGEQRATKSLKGLFKRLFG